VRPDDGRGTDDEALTPTGGTGDEDIDPGPIRLVLVEPRPIQGAAVREMLEREDDFEVVASVRTTEEAADVSADEAPDILVVDVDLPDPGAVEATRRLRRQAPDSALVIIGREADDEAVFRAVQAGASAHVADDDGPSELVDAIRRVAEGEDPLIETVAERPAVAQRVAGAYRELAIRGAARPDRKGRVSPRQLEILRLVAKGMSNEEIAQRLHISRQTVKNHLTAAMRTLGARRRGQAVAAAMRAGWLSII
jgi:DNA-binding NarL/FixJ family response regulator